MNEKRKFKMIDLFAGAGGLSCGLEMAGFEPVLANELVEVFANTYQVNHPNTQVIVGDIRAVDEKYLHNLVQKYGQIDLIAGGPPCQGFSINAPIRSLDDPRNHLFKEFLRIVEEIKPHAVLIENVPGIIQLGRGTVVEQIYKALNEMGYKVDHRILFAGHYGVPQMRYRTIFMAIKDRHGAIQFPQPEYNSSANPNFYGSRELCLNPKGVDIAKLKPQTTVNSALSDLPAIEAGSKNGEYQYSSEPLCEYQKYLRSDSNVVLNHFVTRLAPVNKVRLKYIKPGGNWTDIPEELLPKGMQRAKKSDHTKRYGRLDPNSLASTILTKCDPHWGCFFHPFQERVISVREAARIQSFPDNYIFTGSLTQQYEQIGNAVPPLLAKAAGKTIRAMIIEEENKMLERPSNDIIEIFGYSPDDTTEECRTLWNIGACPFLNLPCHKSNHDKSVIYGTCSVTTPYGNCVICPNRLYFDNFAVLKAVAKDAFGGDVPFYNYGDFIKNRTKCQPCIVALGMNSGKEVKIGRTMSMDWVLAKVNEGELIEYTGVEVQSIDITGNYRDNWYAYKNIESATKIPPSEHGLNWANVHKRLIPQIIRKSLIYAHSSYVKNGLYFIVPDIVYKKFEEIIGDDIPLIDDKASDVITVHTYRLGPAVSHGKIRELQIERCLRFNMKEFANRFISGPNLPHPSELDDAVKNILGVC